MKDQTVRKVLKDNKVPGTSTETRAAEAPSPSAGSAAGFLGGSQAGLCERPGACLDQGGLNMKTFSKRQRENRGTQRLVRELSEQPGPLEPLPHQPLDCESEISSPSKPLNPSWRSPRSTAWVPPEHRPKARDQCASRPAARMPGCTGTKILGGHAPRSSPGLPPLKP